VRPASIDGERVVVPGRQQKLPYDHNAIVTEAVRWARVAHRDRPDPSGLLGESFTLYELRKLHEAMLGERESPGKDTFRRRMEGLVEETGEMSSGTVGKPARLFRRQHLL
jgi:8-oxo-dGTP diphosphatase